MCIIVAVSRRWTHPRRHAVPSPSAAFTSASPALGLDRGHCEIGQCATTSVPPRRFPSEIEETYERRSAATGRGHDGSLPSSRLYQPVYKNNLVTGGTGILRRVFVCAAEAEAAVAATATAAVAATAPPHGAPFALPGERSPRARGSGQLGRGGRSRGTLVERSPTTRLVPRVRVCIPTSAHSVLTGGSVSPLAASRLTAPTSGPRDPGGGGVQADALAGPEDTTLRVRPRSARRCRI